MAVTIDNIKVDFGLGAAPPRVTFLQGRDMDVQAIRNTIRQIEESDEGRNAPGGVSLNGDGRGWIARTSGNTTFTSTEGTALDLIIMPPFDMFFEAGATPFQSSNGNLLGTFVESPGAIVQINNALASSVTVQGSGVTAQDIIDISDQSSIKTWNAQTSAHTTSGSFGAWVNSKALTVLKFLSLGGGQ